jgi:tRNA (adenine22-N1)-methyltransferase
MGGNLIKDILSDSLDKIKDKKLILEPNNDQMVVRKFLMDAGFMIVDEYAISENGKYYEIIVAKKGNITYTENELKFGPILLKKKPEAFISYYNRKIGLLMTVINTTMDQFKKMQKQKEINDIMAAIK